MAWTDTAATYYWKGTDADGDFRNTTGNNWVNSTGTVAGAGKYPSLAYADTIILPDFGAYAITTNLNNSAAAGSIVAFTRQQGFAYGFGTVQNPLYLKLSGSPVFRFEDDSEGDMYLITGTTAISALHVLKTGSSDDALHLVTSHAVTTANITAGNVVLDSSLFGVASTGIATLNLSKQSGGSQPTVTSHAPVTTALNNYGGKFYWNEVTIGALNNYDGTFSCEKSTIARTLTASTCYGGTVDFRTGKPGTITLTAPIAYKGGAIYWDLGESLQRS